MKDNGMTATQPGCSPIGQEADVDEKEAYVSGFSDGWDEGRADAMESVALGMEIVARLGSWDGVEIIQDDDGVSFFVKVHKKELNEPRGLSAAERPVAGRVTPNPVVSNTQEEGT